MRNKGCKLVKPKCSILIVLHSTSKNYREWETGETTVRWKNAFTLILRALRFEIKALLYTRPGPRRSAHSTIF